MTNGRSWTKREDDYMAAHHLRLTCPQIAVKFVDRSAEAVKTRLSNLGLRAFMSLKSVDRTRKPERVEHSKTKPKTKRRTCLAHGCTIRFDSDGPGHRLCKLHRRNAGYDFEEPYLVAGRGV